MIRAFLRYTVGYERGKYRTFQDQYDPKDHKFTVMLKNGEYILSVRSEEIILDKNGKLKDTLYRETAQIRIPADIFAKAYSDFLKRSGLEQKIQQAINEDKLTDFLSGNWKPEVGFQIVEINEDETEGK